MRRTRKTRKTLRKEFVGCLLATTVLALAAFPLPASARVIYVHNGESIQDAVDVARPGDTIYVKPGIYTGTPGEESVVDVQKSRITITGSRRAVIDASGFEYGIMVGPDISPRNDGCPEEPAVRDFKLIGLTIANATDTGVRLVGVRGFRMVGSAYLDNEEYGPFPVCSSKGVISGNFAAGHKDAAIYVGDDTDVRVVHNTVTTSSIGVEIENSADCEVSGNTLTGNTVGILVVVLPGLPMPFTEDVLIRKNLVLNNNLPNEGGGVVALLPPGTGILNVGGDAVRIHDNIVRGNKTVGVAILGNALGLSDARINPFVDDNVVVDNELAGNGFDPDPASIVPGADIAFVPDVIDPTTGKLILTDPDPSDNCFEDNTFDTDFPPGVTAAFPCP